MSAFLRELLRGEEAWTAPRLLEALERRFFVTFHPDLTGIHPLR